MGVFSNTIARIKALITADNKQFKKTMKESGRVAKKTGSGFKKLGNLIKGAVIVTALVKFTQHILRVGKAMDLMNIKAGVVFGKYAKEVKAMAAESSAAMGLTETEFVNAAAGIQDLLIPIGFARKEATGMTKDMMKLSGALSQWSGGLYSSAEVGKIFSKAILGEREELKSLGIAISEAEVQGELLARGQKKLTGNALAQAKAQVTLDLITRKSTDAQAAFAEGGEGLVRTTAVVKSDIKQVGENLQKIFNPALTDGVGLLGQFTSKLREVSGVMAQVIESDAFSKEEKFRAIMFKTLQLLPGYKKQMGFVGMAIDTHIEGRINEEQAVKDSMEAMIRSGATYEEVSAKYQASFKGSELAMIGFYQSIKTSMTKEAAEQKAMEAAALAERMAQQKAYYWGVEGALIEHNDKMREEIPKGWTGHNVALAEANAGLQAFGYNSTALMESLAATLPVIQATTTAWQEHKDQIMLNNYRMEEATMIGAAMGATMMNVMDAMVYASARAGASFGDIARAAGNAARRTISAFIAEGIAGQVKSALVSIPFPFGIIAATLAGGAAAALFNSVIPSFAGGGMVDGPTLAMVGDNPSGKEAMIPSELWGSMGGQDVNVTGVLQGHDMYLQTQRYGEKLARTGRI